MVEAKISGNKVIVEGAEAKEIYDAGWYGKFENNQLELDLVEAVLLYERMKIEIFDDNKKVSLKDFFDFCCKTEKNFMTRYFVYRDLRERGLPIRIGFKGSDFRVYERGATPGTESVKWIVFVASEDYPCKFNQLGKAINLSKNIRALALWAVVDNDSDVTYYIINEAVNL